jgi:hypothetical protein
MDTSCLGDVEASAADASPADESVPSWEPPADLLPQRGPRIAKMRLGHGVTCPQNVPLEQQWAFKREVWTNPKGGRPPKPAGLRGPSCRPERLSRSWG